MGNYFFDNPKETYLDRVDGKAKVTGTAKYSAEYDIAGMTYGVMVGSTITKGDIINLDTKAAERAPGVITVLTHLNAPKLPGYKPADDEATMPEIKKGFLVFSDVRIRFNGQPIALVIADTLERATYAASLVKAQYKKDAHHTDLHSEIKTGKALNGEAYKDYVRGEADAGKKRR